MKVNKVLVNINEAINRGLCKYLDVHDMSWSLEPGETLKANTEPPDDSVCKYCGRTYLRIKRLRDRWPEPKPGEEITAVLFGNPSTLELKVIRRMGDRLIVQEKFEGLYYPEKPFHIDRIASWRKVK